MYNKYQVTNNKRISHRIKKQWITVSLALFMAIGGSAATTRLNVNADSAYKYQPKVSTVQTKLSFNRNKKRTEAKHVSKRNHISRGVKLFRKYCKRDLINDFNRDRSKKGIRKLHKSRNLNKIAIKHVKEIANGTRKYSGRSEVISTLPEVTEPSVKSASSNAKRISKWFDDAILHNNSDSIEVNAPKNYIKRIRKMILSRRFKDVGISIATTNNSGPYYVDIKFGKHNSRRVYLHHFKKSFNKRSKHLHRKASIKL